MNLKERLMFSLDIALGIKAMHSCYIIHTDLRFENIIKAQESYKIANLDKSIDLT